MFLGYFLNNESKSDVYLLCNKGFVTKLGSIIKDSQIAKILHSCKVIKCLIIILMYNPKYNEEEVMREN